MHWRTNSLVYFHVIFIRYIIIRQYTLNKQHIKCFTLDFLKISLDRDVVGI